MGRQIILQRKEEIHGKTENISHLYREKRKYMGRQRILCHISIEKRGNTWEDRESYPVSHLYREKRKYMGRQIILYHISIEKRGNTWEDRESCITSLQRKEEIHGKTENPVSHLYREKRKYMGRQMSILYHISIEKRGNTWEDRESCITSLQRKEEIHGKTENPMSHLYRERREDRESYVTSLQRKEEIHGKTENPMSHLYREKRKAGQISYVTSLQIKEEIHGKTENPVSHLYREKRKCMGRQRILYYIFIEKRGNTWEDRESYVTSLQIKEEIHGRTENPMSHLYREKRKCMGRQIIRYYIFIEERGNTWEDRESYVTSLQIKEEIHGKTENPKSHLYREKRKYMGRQRILCHISIEKRGNTWEDKIILYYISIEKRGKTWEDRESCITSLQRKEENTWEDRESMGRQRILYYISIEKRGNHGKTENHMSHLYREKRKYMGRQRILCHISIEKRGNTWEDRESCITSLQRKEEKHGKTDNPVSHLYRQKRKYMGRQRILCHISIEKRGNTWEDKRILYYISIEKRGKTWEDRESCITSLQRKEEIHGKTENHMSHLYREKRKYMGRQRILCHISIEKRGNTWEDKRILYYISIEKRGKTWEDRESYVTSLQIEEEIHGKTENPKSHLYREKRKYMGRQRILCHISIEKRGNTWEDKIILYYISIEKRGKTWEDRESCITSLQRKEEKHGKTENPMSHLYREKRKYMGRQRIICHISLEKRGNTWEDRESYVSSLQRKEEIHGKTENPVLHLYREKRKYMGRQRILYHISIEKRGNTWEDRES